ncbi:MAG TPA: hypothetical protein VFK03_02540, partial [Candidatus Saccharimonadales bacterium]|nr:hypothetical protein [Candidatus Saccharimonadales bacterium]
EQSFQRLTRDSVLSVTRPLTVSPAEHRAYMPEAGLSLPQDDMTPKLLYSYDPQTLANGQSAAYLTFYSRPAVYDISSRDFDDPLCRSVAQLTIDDKYYDKGLSPAATIHLDDGRIAYVYSSQSDACDRAGNVRGGVSPDKTVRLLKQVKSY